MNNRIMIVEDHQVQRFALAAALEARGFEVELARDQAEVKTILEREGVGFDVVVLDMLLSDSHDEDMLTGADVGLCIQERLRDDPPEFIIYSFHEEPEYIKKAMELGAAKYFNKKENSRHDLNRDRELITHIRMLATKKRLLTHFARYRPEIGLTALERWFHYCRDVLGPALVPTLGVSALALIKNGDTAQGYALAYSAEDLAPTQIPWTDNLAMEFESTATSPRAHRFLIQRCGLKLCIKIESLRGTASYPVEHPDALRKPFDEHLKLTLGNHLAYITKI